MAHSAGNGTHRSAPASRLKVVYVMGAGRSGSTILGITLGNCPGLFYAGELDAWFARAGLPLIDQPEHERFWEAVRSQISGAAPLFGFETQRVIERSLSIFRVTKWRARRRLRRGYKDVSQELYEAVADASGREVIVDTSHYPLRALELQSLNRIELYLIYLMRDPQSVVASFNNKRVAQYNKSTITTNVYLWLTNLLAIGVFLRHPRGRRMFVAYEDFIADPERVLGDVLETVGAGELPPDLERLSTGVPFQGNRVIRSGVVALQGPDTRPAARSALTAVLQLPWTAFLRRLRPRAGIAGASRPAGGRGGAGSAHAAASDGGAQPHPESSEAEARGARK